MTAGQHGIRLFSLAVAALSGAALIYVYLFPPASMRLSRDGVPHYAPPVMHPETGEPLDLGLLIRHYRGD